MVEWLATGPGARRLHTVQRAVYLFIYLFIPRHQAFPHLRAIPMPSSYIRHIKNIHTHTYIITKLKVQSIFYECAV